MKKIVSIFLISLFLFQLPAFAETFKEGKDYQRIPHQAGMPGLPKNTVTVTEFFSYGCPWCYEFEPQLEKWLKQPSKNVTFNRVAVVFERYWDEYAKAYYITVALGIEKTMTPKLFYAIQDQEKTLSTDSAMEDFFVESGIKRNVAIQAFEDSPTLDMEIKKGLQLMQAYQIMVIPSIVVDGEYRTDLQMAQDEKRLMAITQFLVEKSKKEKKLS